MIQALRLAPDATIADIGAGTGYFTVRFARMLPKAKVYAADIEPEMVQHLAARAKREQLANMVAVQAAADDAKLPEKVDLAILVDTYHHVDARGRYSAKLRESLKPGGRVSFIVWGSFEDNPLFAATLGPFMKHVQVPPPPPDAPTIFRFADENKLASTLKSSGLHSVEVRKHQVPWLWPGPPEEAWEALRDLAAPFRKMIDALPPEKKPEVMEEVVANLRRFQEGNQVKLPATLVTGTGVA